MTKFTSTCTWMTWFNITTNKDSKGLDIVVHVYTLNAKLTAQGFRFNSALLDVIETNSSEKQDKRYQTRENE